MTDQYPGEEASRPDGDPHGEPREATPDGPAVASPDAPEGPGEQRPEPPVRTGNQAVDEVLGSLAGLDELPLEEHPGAFERAHDALRAALSDARDRPPPAEAED